MSYVPPQYRCPYCGSTQRPHTLQKVSTGGWIVFAVMLLVCFPLFFIGLLMKDTYQVCGQCGVRLN
jgi:DNA-directed RNA polymerase subunit RPC12/RpoP